MKYDIFSLSRQAGRPVNEDCVGTDYKATRVLLALADGLGGHGMGDVASAIAVDTAKELIEVTESPNDMLAEAFCIAQKRILEKQNQLHNKEAMKTTLSMVLLEDDNVYYGHIGDSRIYFFSGNKYVHRTSDHSVPQMLVLSGRIKEKDIRGHEDRNRLLRVLGVEGSEPRYEISDSRKIKCGDAILLCSDGFWELITEKQMEKALKKTSSAEEWLKLMEEVIVKAGKGKNMDNYSAVALIAR